MFVSSCNVPDFVSCQELFQAGIVILILQMRKGFPGVTSGKEPACQCKRHNETWVWSLGREEPLEQGMATDSSILAWRIPWMEEPGRLQSMGLHRVGHNWSVLARIQIPFIIHAALKFLFYYWDCKHFNLFRIASWGVVRYRHLDHF